MGGEESDNNEGSTELSSVLASVDFGIADCDCGDSL